MDCFDLSNAQKRLIVTELNTPGTDAYIVPFKCIFEIEDEKYVKKALNIVVSGNFNLRITTDLDLNYVQYYAPTERDVFSYFDMSDKNKSEINDLIHTFVSQVYNEILDTPLYRFAIIKTSRKCIVLGNVHHILMDGTAVDIFVRELKNCISCLKEGKTYPKFKSSYHKFVELEKEYLSSNEAKKDEKYWINELSDASEYMPNRPVLDDLTVGGYNFVLTEELTEKLKGLSNLDGVKISPFVLASAVLSLYISRSKRTDGLILNTMYHGRDFGEDVRNMIGMFVNILPLKVKYGPEKTFKEFLLDVKSTLKNGLTHGKLSFNEYSPKLHQMGIDPSSLFTYSIVSNSVVNPDFEMIHEQKSNEFSLSVYVNSSLEDKNGLQALFFEYNKTYFSDTKISHMIKNIHALLLDIANNPEKICEELEIISASEKQLINEYSAGEKIDYDENKTIIDYVEYHAQNNGFRFAAADEDGKLNYADFDRITSSLAVKLQSLGVGVDNFAAVMLPRKREFLISVIGIIKAGGAYVPIDPEYPQDRINYILNDSNARILITTRGLYDKNISGDNVIFFEDLIFNNEKVKTKPKPEDLAYLIYTSGSTGKPKGVMIQHKALMSLCAGEKKTYDLSIDNGVTCYPSFSFDASVMDLFPVLCVGGCCHIISDKMRFDMGLFSDYLTNENIKIAHFPTKLGMEIWQEIDLPVEFVAVGGEKLKKLPRKNPKLINCYGPTEFTVNSNIYLVDQDKDYSNIPIGKPYYNSWQYVVDSKDRLVPIGAPGELVLSGRQIAKGYLNRDELTKERFVDNPFSGCDENKKMYRTGDLVNWNFKGELEYLGRIDSQVKLRGFRIELGEIEVAVLDYEGITASCVLLKNDNLVAYYISSTDIDEDDLKDTLKKRMPEYMVPSYFIKMDSFPMTVNGKIDSNKMPIPQEKKYDIDEIVTPENLMEEELFDLCSQILEAVNFGINTDLFNLGLTSLSAIKLALKISQKYDVKINAKDIMAARTIVGIENKLLSSSTIEKIHHKKQQFYPLTKNQLGVYFDCIKYPEKLIYNIPSCLHFGKDVDPEKLRDIILDVVDNHHYIKTRLVMQEGMVYQERRDDLKVDVDIIEGNMEDNIKSSFVRPFSLFEGPLFRFTIYKTPEEVCVLCDFHHIIFDGTSLNIFLNDLATLYNGSIINEELCTGFDLSLDEIEAEKSELYQEAENYFENKISDFDAATSLFPDINGSEDEGHLRETSVYLDKSSVERFCKDNGITPNNLFLSATTFTLSKFVFSKDILISNISNGRSNYQYQNTLAMLARALPFVLNINSDNTVKDYLGIVQDSLLKSMGYECYPFMKIFDKYGISPEFSYAYQIGVVDDIKMNNSTVTLESLEIESPKFRLAVYIEDAENNFNIISRYNDAIYSKNLVHTFTEGIIALVNKFMERPDALLRDISILSEDGKEEEFKMNPVEEPLLNKLFEKQVEESRDEIALIAADGEFSYGELNRKANRIANALIKRGVKVEDRILFMLKRDSRLIAAMLGIVKAGCAFIPVDPEYPEERIKQILEDSDAKYIITPADLPNALDIDELLLEENDGNPELELTPENLCYLIYTSGSTGKPKGVMLTHGGITNYVSPDPQNIPIHALVTKAHKMISISTVSFIVFLREIFATIMNGMPVVFANEEQSINPLELVKLFEKTGADAFGATPTRLLQYLELEEVQKTMPQCRVIIVGGELFPPQLYNIFAKYTDAEIYNSYGPTEITIASHGKLITSGDISAGEPLLNVTDKIMDMDANPLPYNVVGELYVAGAGVARGYWNNEELTKERFIMYNGLRYYNTGDLAKRDSTGELYVLGRMDNQIKLRGLRIELGEIENTITECYGVKSAVVLVKNVKNTDHLCAYFTEDHEIDIGDLRNVLVNKLPSYMIPSYFVRMDEFPMTPNGKTDLKNFPAPETDDYRLDEIVPPETDLEEEIFGMCSEILDTTHFGVITDLFQLGLTSLSVLKMVAKISHKFGVNVNVTNIMRARNVREIVNEVSSSSSIEEKHYQKQKFYPLTQNQLGVYFDCVKNPQKVTYNLPKCIRFGNDIDPEKLKAALLGVIEKYPYIKTRLVMREGEIYQERQDDMEVTVNIYEGIVDDSVKNDFIKPFSLFEGPLFRFEIYKNSSETCLLADFHHIIVDGTSLNIFFNDLGIIYDGGKLDEEKYNGFDLSLEELAVKKSQLYREAETYFGNKIPNFDSATVISPDLSGKEEDGQLGQNSVSLNKAQVEKFCKDNAITPNNLFLAATVFTLSKFVYNKDILISTISNGRSNPQFQKSLAMMVKTLPIALNINSDLTAADYFDYVENIWLDVLKYECYPFTEISNKYNMFPEFFYAYHGKIIEDITINGRTVERESMEYEALKFKLSVSIIDAGESFNIVSQYNDALYSEDLIETFINSISVVLNKFMEGSNVLLRDISILPEDGKEEEFKMNPVEEPLLNKLFEKQVEESRDEIALIAADGEFSYGELNRKANRIANALIKRGVKVEDRILFMLKRDSRLIAAMLGIVKAGCAFIPMDPEYPEERIKQVLEDSDARYIITPADLPNALDIDELLLEENEENPEPEVTPENLCYLIYTSGSTGKPKGVMLTHGNITNYVSPDLENCYTHSFVNKANKLISIATVAFDLFLHEAFVTLMNGLTLIFANDEESKNPLDLVNLFERTKADSFSATPSRMLQYLEIEGIKEALSNCTVITVAGEKYPLQLHKMLVNCTDAEIYNVYGPTEITISCNTKHVVDDNITVGKPLLNVIEKVMDLDGNPVPVDVEGELYVGGAGVTKGYWNREELNNERFAVIDGIRYYKTGDLVFKEKNGEFSVIGRLDNQIKLRGLRIEIGEVENVIMDYRGIKSAVVVVKNVHSNDHLCAYFAGDGEIDVNDLKDELKKKLTKYMVPTIFMRLDKLPQTPNGKTDIKSLPEPVLMEKEYVAPQNDVEKFFADIFAEILNMSKIGAADNFFDLGGTSLLATKVTIEAMNKGYEIKYGDVFAHPTPRELAKLITGAEESVKEHEEYSYDCINEILKKNTVENFINGEIGELGNVLLTGATGFLGIHVLRDFLENETGSIYCMLRKGKRINPKERLKTLLFYYFSDNYEDLFGSRIHIIEGDITSKSDFEKALNLPVDTVINCAANVKHFASGTQIEDINIGGVVNGVEFCMNKDCKYIQISTTSVAGESVNNFPPSDTIFDEQTLYVGQALDNKYLSSKFLAERVVLEAVTKGLNGKIIRVGNLMARNSDSEFQINFETNGFINRLKAYGAIGKIPYAVLGGEVELTPIDSVARAILTLSKAPKECAVFHAYNNHNIYIADIVEIMNSIGLIISGAEEDEFKSAFAEAMGDESKKEAISGLVTSMGMGKSKGRGLVHVVNNYTIQILYRLGYKWPLISDEYIVMFIKYLKEMDFFDYESKKIGINA